jgi:hypothetical protein
MKSLAVIDKCQVEIVDLKGSYSRSAGSKAQKFHLSSRPRA